MCCFKRLLAEYWMFCSLWGQKEDYFAEDWSHWLLLFQGEGEEE